MREWKVTDGAASDRWGKGESVPRSSCIDSGKAVGYKLSLSDAEQTSEEKDEPHSKPTLG